MRKINLNILAVFCVLMMPLAVGVPAGAVTRYVPSPYPMIQGAIDASAVTGDEIEVAPGTYDEAINFNGKAIRLYSSDGPEVTTIYMSILPPDSAVVTCNSGEGPGTILEGFTITSGNSYKGGGMYNDGSSPTVTNCIFYENIGDYGGGMYNGYGSNPNVTDCIFQGNTARVWGAGMFNNRSSPTVTNCEFLNNDASWDGGGMFNELSSPTLNDCNFIGNTAAQSGGGMYSKNDSNSTVNNCTFSGNEALGTASEMGGGGMYNYDNSSPTVTNCTFSGNTAGNDGGGMYNTSSSPTLTNCTFSNNTTPHNGGGMYNTNSSNPIMTNCSFTGNSSPGYGGGICNVASSSPALTNCNFTENEGGGGGGMINSVNCSPTIINCVYMGNSANYGGGIYNNDNSNPIVTNCTFTNNTATYGGAMRNAYSSPTVTNCILWDDTPDEISNEYSSPVVTYCDVKMPSGTYSGTGNIAADPLFVDEAGGDLRLSSDASPCIDAGNNSAPYLPSTDLAGNPRIVDGDRNGSAIVDMGAYEFQSRLIHNITQDNWYETIQAAINYSNSGDQIEVGPGTYYEAINFKGKGIRLYSSGGQDVTTIDGSGAYHVVQCVSGEGANTILEGFTITGGNAANVLIPDDRGGGMYCESSSPTVTDCTFSNNSAIYGGGIFNYLDSNPKVTDCTFSGNSADYAGGGIINIRSSPMVTNCNFSDNETNNGGGMYNIYSSPKVVNCSFSGNTAMANGGGMYNEGSSPTVTNCIFSGNSANNDGGGMYNSDYSSPTVTNCIFSGNSANEYGGGMYNYYSNPTVTNCTFSNNTAMIEGGGMYNYYSNPTVTNSILWGDEPNEIYDYGTSITTVNYSDIQGGWGDPNDPNNTNINADPRFVDAYNPDPNLWNLRLLYDSPCIDAGDSTSLLAVPVLHDLDGKFRYWDIPSIANTGTGLSTFLDMGAYEFQCSGIGGDNNCDGVVDFKDLAILCNNWLTGTEPEL